MKRFARRVRTLLPFLSVLLVITMILPVLVGCSCTSESGGSSLIATLLTAAPDTPDWSVMYNDLPLLAKEEGLRRPSQSASLDDRITWWSAIQPRVLYGLPLFGIREYWGFDITEVSSQVTASGVSIISGDLDTDAMIQRLRDYGYQEEQYRGIPFFIWTPQVAQEVRIIFPKAIAVLESGPQTALVSMAHTGHESLSGAETAVKQSIDTYLDGNSLADNEDLGEVASLLADYPSAFFCSSIFLTDMLVPYLERLSAPGFLEWWSMLAIGNHQEGDRSLLLFILTFDTAEMAENNVEVVRQRLTEGRRINTTRDLLSNVFEIRSVEASGRHVLAMVELIGEWAENDYVLTLMISTLDLVFLLPGEVGDG